MVKIGFYDDFRPCLVKENGVVDIVAQTGELPGGSAQLWLENLILRWSALRPALADAWETGSVIPLQDVRLRPPVPRPGKVINGRTNFMESVRITPPRPLQTFFKSPDAVIGPGDTVVLPKFRPTIRSWYATPRRCKRVGSRLKANRTLAPGHSRHWVDTDRALARTRRAGRERHVGQIDRPGKAAVP